MPAKEQPKDWTIEESHRALIAELETILRLVDVYVPFRKRDGGTMENEKKYNHALSVLKQAKTIHGTPESNPAGEMKKLKTFKTALKKSGLVTASE